MNKARYSLLLCWFLVLAIYLRAEESASVFFPQVQSENSISLLLDGDEYDPLPEANLGLNTPFDSWAIFRDGLVDAFRISPAQQRIFSYRYQDQKLHFQSEINALAGYEYSDLADASFGYIYKGMRIKASINENWGMKSIWYSGAFYGDHREAAELSPLVDSFYKTSPNAIWVDNLSGDIWYRNPNFYFSLGRDNFQIGNSISGSIILNDRVNEYGYFLGEGSFGRFRLSLLHASLVADDTLHIYHDNIQANSKHYPDKYLALHQISYGIKDRFELFFGETLIYGDRGIDVNYLLPHAFWRATEHNLRDRDNIMIYGGTNFYPVDNILIYAHAMIDEMRYAKLFSDWWGNKYAVQSGISYLSPQSGKALLTLEFTAVRPWIYTHFLPWASYSHDQKALGYPMGSNLINYSAELHYPLPLSTTVNINTSYTRQGSIGNSFELNYLEEISDVDNTNTKWLQGEIEDRFRIQTSIKSSIFAHHNLLLGYGLEYDRDEWDSSIYAGWQLVY